MRRIVCRFADESDFLDQFKWQHAASIDDAAVFSFVGDFELPLGEQIRLTALVSSNREQCHLRMTVQETAPMARDSSTGGRVFRYRARVAPQDAVWLLAFRQKMCTSRWIEEIAA